MKIKLSLPHLTAFAFLAIVLFISTQLFWWYIFFSQQQKQSFIQTRQHWQSEQRLYRMIHDIAPLRWRKQLQTMCEANHPHLTCKAPLFTVRSEALSKVANNQRRHQRMFLFEGLFFLLIVFLGHFVIWQGVKVERELKDRQQNFLSAVSHEIRTPIGTMRLLLETLQLRNFSEEKQKHYLMRLEHQLNRLQNSCEQVVAAAMLDGPKPDKANQPVDLSSEAHRVLEQDRFELESRGATVAWNASPDKAPVSLDPLAFEMVIHNLLDNAIKYNPKENKIIRVSTHTQEKYCELWIEDNGPGIAPEEQEKVFTPFYRVGQELTRQSDGLGLGLYLVKGLTQQMGGQVKYLALEEGSRFVLSWKKAPQRS